MGALDATPGHAPSLLARALFCALSDSRKPDIRYYGRKSMPTEKKVAQVAELKGRIERAEIAIAASYQRVNVAQQIELRRAIREAGGEMRVVKNTLLKIAATDAGLEQFAQLADGPTAIVFGYEEPVAPARAVANYLKENDESAFKIRSAIVGGELVDAAYVEDLATVPPRDELLSRIAGGLVGKLRELMMLIDATPRELANLLEARANQLEDTTDSSDTTDSDSTDNETPSDEEVVEVSNESEAD